MGKLWKIQHFEWVNQRTKCAIFNTVKLSRPGHLRKKNKTSGVLNRYELQMDIWIPSTENGCDDYPINKLVSILIWWVKQ